MVTVRHGHRVRIRARLADDTSRTVDHCHIFDHEERGMMGVLRIV